MAINKVGTKGIVDGSVAQADFKDGDITSAKLGDSQVTNAKLTNSSVTLAGQSISLGGSIDLNVTDWQSVVTADGSTNTTAVSGQGYFIDTTSATHTINLPASANRGDFVAIKDYAGTFGTNNLTIARNGHNIQGAANDSLITTNRASLVLVYVDSTKGWLYWEEHNVADLQAAAFISATGGTITTSGDYKIHSFTGDGCFVVSSVGNPVGGADTVSYLVVAGGGGGAGSGGGGGGAGGFREGRDITPSYTASPLVAGTGLTVTATTYPVTVGAGGAGGCAAGPSPGKKGTPGSNSVFSTITSTAGGGAGMSGDAQTPCNASGLPGGSGGGAGQNSTPPPRSSGGTGNSPPVSPSQGNKGGLGQYAGNTPGAGGGGGATAVGGNSSGGGDGGDGGAGATTSISGSPTSYSGGGGGGATNQPGSSTPGNGGTGGGGPAGSPSSSPVDGGTAG